MPSPKDTVMALEALSEYELKRYKPEPDANMMAMFTVPGKTNLVTLAVENNKEKIETDLEVTQLLCHLQLKIKEKR